MKRLTILYDPMCGFCVRCAVWVQGRPAFVRIETLAAGSRLAVRRYPTLFRRAEELVVVSDEGGVYRGAYAFIMGLWALEDYREWALWLARPGLFPLARRAFEVLSSNRRTLSTWLGLDDENLLESFRDPESMSCGPIGHDDARVDSLSDAWRR